MKQEYDVLSPDRVSIHPTEKYSSRTAAMKAFIVWRKRFEAQGYYSTVITGERKRIPLRQLANWCEIIPLPRKHF